LVKLKTLLILLKIQFYQFFMNNKIFLLCILFTGVFKILSAQENTLQKSMTRGESIYSANCSSCHMPTGEGLGGAFPPLVNSNWLKNQKQIIGVVIKGLEGEIKVNDEVYDAVMPPFNQLSDQEIADVLNFVSNSWGNKQPIIKLEQVKAERK
jgi:nitrite reductase (NO-forming)